MIKKRKDTFVSVASHELRTPLTWVLGYAELLAHGHLAPEQAQEAIEAIYHGSVKRDAIITDLLSLSRIQSNQLTMEQEPVDLPGLVQEARGVIEPRLAGREVLVDIDPTVIGW